MSDAPERIWADAPSLFDGTDLWHTSREAAEKTATEYVRADIFAAKDAENARLREAILGIAETSNYTRLEWAKDLARNALLAASHDDGPDDDWKEDLSLMQYNALKGGKP